jgi:hypothetical protein
MTNLQFAVWFCLILCAHAPKIGNAQQPGNGPEDWVEVLRSDARLKASITLKSESWPGCNSPPAQPGTYPAIENWGSWSGVP